MYRLRKLKRGNLIRSRAQKRKKRKQVSTIVRSIFFHKDKSTRIRAVHNTADGPHWQVNKRVINKWAPFDVVSFTAVVILVAKIFWYMNSIFMGKCKSLPDSRVDGILSLCPFLATAIVISSFVIGLQ